MTEHITPESAEIVPPETRPEMVTATPVATRPEVTGRLTIAHGLMLLVLLLAAALRLTALTSSPLSPAEAEQAFLVWQFWQPGSLSAANTTMGNLLSTSSPAYFSFTSMLMLVFGSADAVMRLVPAIFGLLTVLLPWLLRRQIGEAGAIVTAFFFAVSPLLAASSRTAGGDAIAMFAVLLFVVGWLRYQEAGRPGWLYTMLAALGLGLASTSLFYTGLVAFSAALLVQSRLGPGLLPPTYRPDRTTLRNGLVIGGVLFLGASTLFFFNLGGLGAAFAQLGNWFSAFTFTGDLQAWLEPILLVLRYEPALLILGLVSLVWATWKGSPLPGLISYWFTAALLLAIVQHNVSANVLVLIMAGYLLVGLFADSMVMAPAEETPDPSLPVPVGVLRWGLFILLLAAGATFYFNLSRHLRQVALSTDNIGNFLLAFIALVAGIALVNFVRVWDRRAANQATMLALLVLFGIYSWGTAWWLTHEGASDPRERWIASTTDPGVWLLQEILSETSYQLDNAINTLNIVAAVDHPVLRWYLRDFDNALFGETIPTTTNSEALITPAGANLNLGVDYFGADFGLFRHPPLESNLQCAYRPNTSLGRDFLCTVEQTLRWWLFHDAPDNVRQENIILWVRTDLTLEER